jgi:TldD protein
VLIEDGILKGYIHDRLNARLMGVEPTGNGRRESYAHAPMPRMTNTFMRGQDDPAELLSRVKNGIFAKSFGGGQVDITSGKFVFTAPRPIWSGRQAGRPDQGRHADRRRADRADKRDRHRQRFRARRGVGMCGKGGQSRPASASPACWSKG